MVRRCSRTATVAPVEHPGPRPGREGAHQRRRLDSGDPARAPTPGPGRRPIRGVDDRACGPRPDWVRRTRERRPPRAASARCGSSFGGSWSGSSSCASSAGGSQTTVPSEDARRIRAPAWSDRAHVRADVRARSAGRAVSVAGVSPGVRRRPGVLLRPVRDSTCSTRGRRSGPPRPRPRAGREWRGPNPGGSRR